MRRAARRGKYNARKTTVDNIVFASKREAARYVELKLLQRAKRIADLECQPQFPIVVNGQTVAKYVADFQYRELAWDFEIVENLVVEDVKGMKTPVYRLKKNLVEAQYGIQIREV